MIVICPTKFGGANFLGVYVKILVSLLMLFAFSTDLMAQKTYVDPNLKVKKGLLEPGEKPAAISAQVETKAEAKSELDPIKKRYCACLQYIRFFEQKMDLSKKLRESGAMTYEEEAYYPNQQKLENYNGLLKRYAAQNDLETDEFECDIEAFEAKKPKDYKKPLDNLDKTCKFQEIERKKIND